MPWVTSTISPTSTSASTGCSGSIRAPSPSPTPITSASSSSWPTRRSNTSRTRGGRSTGSREAARADLYEESLAAEIEAIEAGIRDDKATNLQTYKREIMETLNGAVILRYSYAEGVTEHTLRRTAR